MALDFPLNPAPGDTYGRWIFNGTSWLSFGGAGGIPDDAPVDGQTYGRMDNTWEEVLPIEGGTLTGNLEVKGTLKGDLDATFNGDVWANRDIHVALDIHGERDLTLARNSSVTGNSYVLGNTNLGGSLTIGGATNLSADPALPLQAATKQYVDAVSTNASATFVPLAGGTMTGMLTLPGNVIGNLQAVPLQQVNSIVSAYLPLAGGTMTGQINTAALPTADAHAASKQYVDEAVAAQALFQGPWHADTNVPDLTNTALQINGYSWIVETPDPAAPFTITATVPGLTGEVVYTGDTVIWSTVAGEFFLVPGSSLSLQEAQSMFLPFTGGTLTGALVLNGNATNNLSPVTLQQMNAANALYLPLTGGSLSGPGNLSAAGTLGVTGAATFSGNASIGGIGSMAELNVTTNGAGITGNTLLYGNLEARGQSSLATTSGGAVIGRPGPPPLGNLLVYGDTTLTGQLFPFNADRNILALNPLTYVFGGSGTVPWKIRSPNKRSDDGMFYFTVRIMTNYSAADIDFSGYVWGNPTNGQPYLWSPQVRMSSGGVYRRVIMGLETDGTLYVWIGAAGVTTMTGNVNYAGIAVIDHLTPNGPKDRNTGWSVVRTANDADMPNRYVDRLVYPPSAGDWYNYQNELIAAPGITFYSQSRSCAFESNGRQVICTQLLNFGGPSSMIGTPPAAFDWGASGQHVYPVSGIRSAFRPNNSIYFPATVFGFGAGATPATLMEGFPVYCSVDNQGRISIAFGARPGWPNGGYIFMHFTYNPVALPNWDVIPAPPPGIVAPNPLQ